MDLAELEELRDVPPPELVRVTVRLPKEDVEHFRRLAERDLLEHGLLRGDAPLSPSRL